LAFLLFAVLCSFPSFLMCCQMSHIIRNLRLADGHTKEICKFAEKMAHLRLGKPKSFANLQLRNESKNLWISNC
jgi:hypothetical protein